jgi:hypothetical protein
VILKGLHGLMDAVRTRAEEHRRTPMIGRTHGVHAEPMTFGLKLALWYAELSRDITRVERAREVISVGKLSGAVGTFAHLPPSIEADVCRTLGLEPAAVASQVIQRDRHAVEHSRGEGYVVDGVDLWSQRDQVVARAGPGKRESQHQEAGTAIFLNQGKYSRCQSHVIAPLYQFLYCLRVRGTSSSIVWTSDCYINAHR